MMRARFGLALAGCTAFITVAAGAAAQPSNSSAPSAAAMRRALEPSMERVLILERYFGTVVGLTKHPSRMTRSDGFVYLSDLAPVMRQFAELGERESYLALRQFLERGMVRENGAEVQLSRRYRADAPFELATPSGYLWTGKALLEGWRSLGDTASAQLLARINPGAAGTAAGRGEMYKLSTDCGDALDVVRSDPAPARAVLVRARTFVGSPAARKEQLAMGVTAAEGEVDLLSCLTRVGLALNNPDVAVRYLDRMLDVLQPLLTHSGRTDLGTGADVLLTLHRVREAGPKWSAPSPAGGR
ncbi:MAG: hypothetical protein FJ363_01310 [Gemmatimonadetes bacterium]|nr:hypothetical protein [Gemmatimonadota bacterium]